MLWYGGNWLFDKRFQSGFLIRIWGPPWQDWHITKHPTQGHWNWKWPGPFDQIPFDKFIQSPIGLVPKAGGQTRLIFHLSYNFKTHASVNAHIPHERCTVKYRDLDHAIDSCIHLIKNNPDTLIWMGVSDWKSAFRMIPLAPKWWAILIMKPEIQKLVNGCILLINVYHLGHP